MKYHLYTLLALASLVSCDSGDDPVGTDLRFNAKSLVTITGGARWFEVSDTGTYYDANVQFTVMNPSTSPKRIVYEIRFGLEGDVNNDSSLLRSKSGLFMQSDTLTVAAGKTLSVNDNYVIDICRLNHDWTKSYRYKLTVHDLDGDADPLVSEENLAGSTDLNRFHGVIFTVETSPDPISIIDSPDDSDYTTTSTDWMELLPIYPNPSYNQSSLTFFLKEKGSIEYDILRTPRSSIRREVFGTLPAGTHQLTLILNTLPPGQYRVQVKGEASDGKPYSAHGDIINEMH